MPPQEVEAWAANLTVVGMESKIREMEVWVAEIDDHVVAWGAIGGDRLEGLYTEPAFANQGVATELLAKLETLMRERGIRDVLADSSSNAVAFYLRRGYQFAGTPNGEAQPIIKHLR
jgi:putative acetyltransferase